MFTEILAGHMDVKLYVTGIESQLRLERELGHV